MHKRFRDRPTPQNRLAWIAAAKEARKLKRSDIYISESRILSSGNDNRFWKFVKSKFKPVSDIPILIHDNVRINDPIEIAHCFNEYFSSVFVPDNGMPLLNLADPALVIADIQFTPERVRQHLEKCAPKLSSGPDNIPQIVLPRLSDVLSIPLSQIFAASFALGVLPAQWKTAKIIPIHKKKLRTSVQNYRPISLLCCCSKVMESIISECLVDFLEFNELISANQFGFRGKGLLLVNCCLRLMSGHNLSIVENVSILSFWISQKRSILYLIINCYKYYKLRVLPEDY
jgi:hypothetical protein